MRYSILFFHGLPLNMTLSEVRGYIQKSMQPTQRSEVLYTGPRTIFDNMKSLYDRHIINERC